MQQVYWQFNRTRQSFKNVVCKDPTLYRPPYGNTNSIVRALLNKMGMRAVLWNLDTLDWHYAEDDPATM